MTRALPTLTLRTVTTALPDVTHRKGEPVVTAIWMTASAATLALAVSLPLLEAIGSPLQDYVVPAVALLYGGAILGTCAYNRLRYGRVCPNPLPKPRARRSRAAARRVKPLRQAKFSVSVVNG